MIIYEIGSNFLKISNSSQAKTNQFFEETEKISYQHKLEINDPDFLKECIDEISKIHQELKVSGKLVIILPYFLTTSRIINLPVVAKNKINMMIPFQLDESLPSGSQAMHWIEHIYKIDKSSSNICLSLINKDLFQQVHHQLKANGLFPNLVTTELSIYLNLVEAFKKPKFSVTALPSPLPSGQFVILDMGEQQTKAYFFVNGQLVFNHYSNVGSQNIDENIADNYELDLHEAKVFKEENGFLFSTADYATADQDQVIFAKLMEKTLEPIILDFAKWDLAFRSKTSMEIDKCFIVGGMSKMENIESFLTEQLEVETECLPLDGFSNSIEYTEFFTHQALNIINSKSGKPGNFLKDQFKLSSGSSNVASNSAFFASRAIIFSCVLMLFLSIERIFIEMNIDKTNRELKKVLKSKTLALGKRDQVTYRRNHQKLKNLIKPRLEKIEENSLILNKELELPTEKLYDFLSKAKLIKNINMMKISIFEKSISSEVKIISLNDKEKTLQEIQSKFGDKVTEISESNYEIVVR